MAVNLLTMRRMVRDRLGIPTNDGFMTDPVINTNLNLAITAFESEHRWPWNETQATLTVPSTGQVALPTDWRATRAVVYGTETLDQLPIYDMTRLTSGTTGHPRYYAISGSTLHIGPPPGSSLDVDMIYYREPMLLANDVDEPRIPSEHVGTIVAKACQLCSTRESDRSLAGDHFTEYQMGIQRAKKDLHRSNTRGVGRRIRPGAWL